MAKSKLHIICGTCGDNTNLSFDVSKLSKLESEDNNGRLYQVTITCENCSTLHCLDEFLDESKKTS